MTDMTVPTSTTDLTSTDERRMPWADAPLAFILGAVGILALAVGLLTPWVTVAVDDVAGADELQAAIDVAIEEEYGSANPIGLSLDDGAMVIVFSVAFAALLALHLKRGRQGKGLPTAALVVASILALVGVGNVADIGDTNDQLQLLLPVSITVAFGLWATVIGGVLAMSGATIAIVKAEPKPARTDADS